MLLYDPKVYDRRYIGPPIQTSPTYQTGVIYPDYQCMSLACDRDRYRDHRVPYGNDMVTPGAVDTGTPVGQEPSASEPSPFNVLEIFQGMSTTTLLLLGGAAYFLFFRKGR